MFVYLVRHGETLWNVEQRILGVTDIELTKTGFLQAQALANAFRSKSIQAVYSSDLSRAFQTAKILAEPHKLEVRAHVGLREMNQGEIEGLTFEELRDQQPEFLESWRQDPSSIVISGGESLVELQERTWNTVCELAEAHSDENIVLVSHNLAIVAALCRLLGLSLKRFRQLRQGFTGVTLLEHTKLGWAVHYMNVMTHLHGVEGYMEPSLRISPHLYREGEPRWSPDEDSE
jgi:broad specificity phosphatase PhoE